MTATTNPVRNAIRTMREAQELSQRRLATLAGVLHAYLSQVENGLETPSPDWLRSVTDALGRNLASARPV